MTRPTALRIATSRIAVAFLLAAGLSSAYYIGVSVAHADATAATAAQTSQAAGPSISVATPPPAASSGLDVIGVFAVLGAVLGSVSLMLAGASVAMHFIKNHTSNKTVATVTDDIDKIRAEVSRGIDLIGIKTVAPTLSVAPSPKAPQAGRVMLSIVAVLALTGLVVTAALGTAGCSGVKAAETAVIDCTKASQPAIESLILEFRTLLQGDAPNWSAVESRAIAAGETIGGCALAELIAGMAKPAIARSVDPGRATLEDFRSRVAGGATFHTATGDL